MKEKTKEKIKKNLRKLPTGKRKAAANLLLATLKHQRDHAESLAFERTEAGEHEDETMND